MYILLEMCQNPTILRGLYFADLILNVAFTLIPIVLVVMIMIDFAKATINGDDKAKKDVKIVFKRIMYAFLIFAVPWIVDLFMGFMSTLGFDSDYGACLEIARTGDFEAYDKLYEEEKKIEKEKKKAQISLNSTAVKKQLTDGGSGGRGGYASAGMGIPRYYQNDYSDVKLSSDGSKNVAESGCGFTSSAMIVSYLTGKNITPREFVGDWSRKYYVYDVGMSWGLPAAAASHYGLGAVQQTASIDTAYNALKNKHPVMSAQSAGLFTSGGHLIVLSGVTSDGKILVNDPNKYNAVTKGYNDRAFTKSEISASGTQYFIWPTK